MLYIVRINSKLNLISGYDKSQGHSDLYVKTCRCIKCRKNVVVESHACQCVESIMYILQLVVSLFLVLGLCDGLDFKTTECEQRCKTKVRMYRMYVILCIRFNRRSYRWVCGSHHLVSTVLKLIYKLCLALID
jgi:hypothetical protein